MSIVDAAGRRMVPPGTVDLWIGGARPAAGGGARIAVRGQKVVPAF
jgi:beta-glucosidase